MVKTLHFMSFRLIWWKIWLISSRIKVMDILTDIFNSAGLRQSLLHRRSFYSAWAMRFPCEKSMGFHVVFQGEAFVRSSRFKKPLHLRRGDLVMMKRGFDHEVATDLKTKVKPQNENPSLLSQTNEKGPPLTTLVSGLYQFQTEPIHPLFNEIPDYIVMRSEEMVLHSPLQIALQLLSAELEQAAPGSDAVTKSLVDVLFHYIFRNWLDQNAKAGCSWSQALKDEQLQKAISVMHSQPEKDWTVDDLAFVAGLSRAAFAQKFKKVTGDTPAHYLAKVRIQRAMDLLRATSQTLEKIAESVGYNDSFVFSKAFKRIQGISPREYKKNLASAS